LAYYESLKDWEEGRKSYIRPMFFAGIIRFHGYDPAANAEDASKAVR
jgi:hypothetical protein